MGEWKTYAKAARKTAQKQAPGARAAVNRTVKEGAQSARAYTNAAGKVAGQQTRKGAQSSMADVRATMRATASVAEQRYRRARIGTRIMRASRDASIMALSIFAIWFVLSKIMPIPIMAVLIVMGILVVLRFVWALFYNEFGDDESAVPATATGSKGPFGAKKPD